MVYNNGYDNNRWGVYQDRAGTIKELINQENTQDNPFPHRLPTDVSMKPAYIYSFSEFVTYGAADLGSTSITWP